MADDVTRPRAIVFQQALHGYSDGHREIASSVQLAARDARTMLAMSDLASTGTRLPEQGYLTGYPLKESEYYAIARTWPAPEMPRPGCVWTHTLLMPFAEIEAVVDGQDILAAFRRPMSTAPSPYASPAPIDLVATQAPDLPTDIEPWVKAILFALYGRPSEMIVTTAPSSQNAEAAILALWLQQPIQIRKHFAFCTFTTADRSTDRLTFDLQVVPAADRGTRAQFPKATLVTDLTDDVPAVWIDPLLADLRDPARTLSRSLRNISDRSSVVSALWLWHLVGAVSERPEVLSEALELLRSSPSLATTVPLSRVAEAVAPQALRLEVEGFAFLLEHLAEISEQAKANYGETVARAVWLREPIRLNDEVFHEPEMSRAVLSAGAKLSADEVLHALIKNPDLAEIALSANASILADSRFWTSSAAFSQIATQHLANSPDLWQSAVSAAMESRTVEVADNIARVVGTATIWQALVPRLNTNGTAQELRPWLQLAVSDVTAVAGILASGEIHSVSALASIARMIGPQAIRNDKGEDPWLSAVQHVERPIQLRDVVFLFPFLTARALGAQTKNRVELLTLSFDSVYQAAAANIIDEQGWGLLERYLPDVPFWASWDRCYRLRQIGAVFVERNIEPAALIYMTQDDRLFAETVRLLAKSRDGRRYLRSAQQLLIPDGTPKNEKVALRAKIIEHSVW
jgi:hypothetical protein